MDRTADPLSNFYQYATGGWMARNPVPADKSRWGAFDELIERNAQMLRSLLDQAAASTGPPARRQIGDFYASALDQPQRDRVGFRPLADLLGRIEAAGDGVALARLLAELHRVDVRAFFLPFVLPDRRNSRVHALYFWQGGLSLPDRDYYLTAPFEAVRGGLLEHAARLLTLAGDSPDEARRSAARILELETRLGEVSRSATDARDQERNYNRRSVDELTRAPSGFPWREYLDALAPEVREYVILGQPEFFAAVGTLFSARPLAQWKTYLRWHLVHAAAPFLHSAAVDEDFDFFRRQLLGQREITPPWRRAVEAVDRGLGEALGRAYVEEHFPPESRRRMTALIEDLTEVFTERLRTIDWMSGSTREEALRKFSRFRARIGHPETFRDYSTVLVNRDDYFGNEQRAKRFEFQRRLGQVGKPVDPAEWEMTPPMVNAYFDPSRNEIFFPAGILQPPFFDPAMDDAVNYGGIGAVIGHEITHGYDDQGRRFDADGNLRDWWSAADAAEFGRRAEAVVAEYSAVEVLPGARVNGALTVGENIADLGGVSIAFEALQRRLARGEAPGDPIDGLSPAQRFFISWSQVWRTNCLEPELRRRLVMDPHAPGAVRGSIPVAHIDAFRAAFASSGRTHGGTSPNPPLRIW